MAGEHVWNFADFATAEGLKRVGGNCKDGGLFGGPQPVSGKWPVVSSGLNDQSIVPDLDRAFLERNRIPWPIEGSGGFQLKDD